MRKKCGEIGGEIDDEIGGEIDDETDDEMDRFAEYLQRETIHETFFCMKLVIDSKLKN